MERPHLALPLAAWKGVMLLEHDAKMNAVIHSIKQKREILLIGFRFRGYKK